MNVVLTENQFLGFTAALLLAGILMGWLLTHRPRQRDPEEVGGLADDPPREMIKTPENQVRMWQRHFQGQLEGLVDDAVQLGFVLTIDNVPTAGKPLAMGELTMVPAVRPCRAVMRHLDQIIAQRKEKHQRDAKALAEASEALEQSKQRTDKAQELLQSVRAV